VSGNASISVTEDRRFGFGMTSSTLQECCTPRAAPPELLQFRAVAAVESRLRVRYQETDAMGIAHHGNYVTWFEIGRTDFCRVAGFTYSSIESLGYLLVVTDIQCRYRTPYRYDDEVLVRTSLQQIGSRGMKFTYHFYDATGERLHASGSSSHIWLDQNTRRPVRGNEEVIRLFEPWLAGS
jgi:acyl-CoA thioester hydrolase